MTVAGKQQGQAPRRVFIVDDHPIVREGLDSLISKQDDLVVCGHASDVDEALELIAETQPDAAVIDISLKTSNGLNLIKELKARKSPVRMLVSSIYEESLYAERSLKAGAMGYINKQEASGKIVGAIRSVLEGRVYLSPRMEERLLSRMVGRGTEENRGESVSSLSNRELEVFEFIGTGLTTSEIAERLNLSVKTIQTYRQRIKEKLQLRNSTELVRRASNWIVHNS